MLPSPDILNEFSEGKFVLSNLAAKRANQLREGAIPLVRIESNHPLTIALAEIAAGHIKPIMPSGEEVAIDQVAVSILADETVPGELGLLLPALEEIDAVFPEAVLEGEDEHDEHEIEADGLSLGDLVGEEEEVAPVAAEEETLSLSDIAEQESADDEEHDE